MKKKNQNAAKNMFPYLILILVIFGVLMVLNMGSVITHEMTTGELLKNMGDNKVTEITITPSQEEGIYYVNGKLEDYKDNESFQASMVEEELSSITSYAKEHDLKLYETKPDPGKVSWLYIVINIFGKIWKK